MHIAIVLFDGFDNLDVIGPFEVVNHAHTFGAEVEVGLYTLAPQELVTSSHGLRIEPDGVLGGNTTEGSSQVEEGADVHSNAPDLVVVPGGGWGNHAGEGTWAQVERGPLGCARTHAC